MNILTAYFDFVKLSCIPKYCVFVFFLFNVSVLTYLNVQCQPHVQACHYKLRGNEKRIYFPVLCVWVDCSVLYYSVGHNTVTRACS